MKQTIVKILLLGALATTGVLGALQAATTIKGGCEFTTSGGCFSVGCAGTCGFTGRARCDCITSAQH